MSIEVTIPPETEPVTLDEARDQLRVDDDNREEDSAIKRKITTARRWIEKTIKRKLIRQTLTWYGSTLSGTIELTPNLQSVSSIKYLDGDGVQQTLNPASYREDKRAIIGTVSPSYDQSWPSVRNVSNSVEIEFIAGYGAAEDVPEEIKDAMLIKITDMHENRQDTIIGVSVSEIDTAANLISEYRVITIE